MLCPNCGDEVDDYSACACAFEQKPGALRSGSGRMREMVKRKLERQRGEKAKDDP